ncbi:helix-turn-helix domain-containing protein [Sphingomonas psychrotolerans]|uniref:Helix-turn-helix domain-containing protein n=1 Tax=Sphingomonas psychrotolerans TaxID=1327635 RepID=A0ABU3N1W1_9SPHN|nr:YdaS family helix-turn-helix protein [Sphingomonas psychrotolerans]MDT8758256.1 helix-turn-helix domain-containing protein [Sphingomonas psychrotolerans]
MSTTPTRYEALLAAADAYGTQSAMGDALGVSQPTIWRWLKQSRQLPAEYVLRVEADTGISRHHLRPDIYPPESPRFLGVDRRAARVSFERNTILQRELIR